MTLAKLVRTDDAHRSDGTTTVTWDKFPDDQALAAENERARLETHGRLSWVECSPFELGLLTAYAACVLGAFGDNDDQ